MGIIVLNDCGVFHVPKSHVSYGFGKFSSTVTGENCCLGYGFCFTPVPRRITTRIYHRKLPKNLRHPRRTVLPPDIEVNTFLKKKGGSSYDEDSTFNQTNDDSVVDEHHNEADAGESRGEEEQEVGEDGLDWESEEIDAISSMFIGRIPQKPRMSARQRPLPLPLPYKIHPLGLPSPKKRARPGVNQSSYKHAYKNPTFLVGLAREIRNLPPEKDVSVILNKSAHLLQKGSLSLTVRELGHMGLPARALQVFCWCQKHPRLFPDDRLLASTAEVLAMTRDLKMQVKLESFLSLASQSVYEAVVRGIIRSGSLKLAYKLLSAAKNSKRMLDPGIYAKLILELGKNPDNHVLVLNLLEELAGREDLKLKQQDCTAIMKICIKMGKFETVESLYDWFKNSGHDPTVVMYTTMIHSRYCQQKYREALALVWEMEASDCLFDLPAYRVAIKLFVALNDLSRTVRYFSKLKEAGFSPPFHIYVDVIKVYASHGRLAKCSEVIKEAEMAGFKFNEQTRSLLMAHDR